MLPSSASRSREPFVLLLALAAALAAQYLFTGELLTRNLDSNTWEWRPEFTAATLLLVLAVAGTWSLGTRRLEPPADQAAAGSAPRLPARPPMLLLPIGLAVGLYLLASATYLFAGETLLVQLAWVGSVVGLLAPLAANSFDRASLGCVLAGLRRRPVDLCLVAGLTLLGFGLRAWKLEDIPSHVDNDVALMGVHALQLVVDRDYRWIGASTSAHLLSYDQFLAWSMRIFGADHAGLVAHSVLFGTLTIPLVYALGRSMFNGRVGLVAAALLCVGYTHIHFSRILFGAVTIFLATLIVLLLHRGVRTGRPLPFALAGVVAGFGPLLYDSARVIPLVALALFGWRVVTAPADVRRAAPHWLLFALGAVAAFGPILVFAVANFDSFVGRGDVVALWTPEVWNHEKEVYRTDSALAVILNQIGHTFLTLHLYGDGSPHFSFPRPMVAAVTAALFVLGVGQALRRLRDPRHFLLLAWIVLTFVLGGVITYDPPYWPHLNVVLPAVVVLAGLGADRLVVGLAPAPGTPRRLAILGALAAAVVFTGVTNWQTYYASVRDNAAPRIRIARFLDDLPDGRTVYLLSDGLSAGEYAFRFFAADVPLVDVRPAELPALTRSFERPATFVVVGHEELVERLVAENPEADVEAHRDPQDRVVFVSVTVDG